MKGRGSVTVSVGGGEELGGYKTVNTPAGVVTLCRGGRVGYFKKNTSSDVIVVASGVACGQPSRAAACSELLRLCAVARRNAHNSEAPTGTSETGGVWLSGRCVRETSAWPGIELIPSLNIVTRGKCLPIFSLYTGERVCQAAWWGNTFIKQRGALV